GLLEQGVFTGQGQELLGELLARQRPQTRTATTRKNYRDHHVSPIVVYRQGDQLLATGRVTHTGDKALPEPVTYSTAASPRSRATGLTSPTFLSPWYSARLTLTGLISRSPRPLAATGLTTSVLPSAVFRVSCWSLRFCTRTRAFCLFLNGGSSINCGLPLALLTRV